jgi:hypothetical protein
MPGDCLLLYLFMGFAATLATAVPKWFLGPIGPGKIPKVSVLEAESSRPRHDSTSFPEEVHFS